MAVGHTETGTQKLSAYVCVRQCINPLCCSINANAAADDDTNARSNSANAAGREEQLVADIRA